VGDVVGGYRLEERLGEGGMGVVFRATELALTRVVALKLIRPHLARDPRVRERFVREARRMAALEHPHVVPVYATGEVDGQLFLAMRFIEGVTLEDLLATEGPLSLARFVPLLAQVAAAIDAAHAHGLVHRDIKPGNVLLAGARGREQAYLTDFGLVKALAGETALTDPGGALGTPAYMAPEQVRDRPVSAQTDVYALGCLCFEMLSGRLPFLAPDRLAILYAPLDEPPPSILAFRPDLPASVDAALQRALAKGPDARQRSAGVLAEEIAAAAAPQGRDQRRRRRAWLVGALAGALIVGGAAVSAVLVSRSGSSTPTPNGRATTSMLRSGSTATSAPTAPAAYHASASRVCALQRRRFAAVSRPTSPRELASYYEELAALTARGADELLRLRPPASLQALHQRAVALTLREAAALRSAASALRRGTALGAVQRSLQTDYARIDDEANSVFLALHLPACAPRSGG
jgi:serine/threonine protein kinase